MVFKGGTNVCSPPGRSWACKLELTIYVLGVKNPHRLGMFLLQDVFLCVPGSKLPLYGRGGS